MSIKKEYNSCSEADTEALAAEIAGFFPDGAVIALHGDLGAGKTVFSRGFARALGIDEPVSSPTYTIIQEYKLSGGNFFYHMDLYRIADSAAALAFGTDEFLEESGAYSLVEWPERISDILPEGTVHVNITHLDDSSRRITVELP